ncbi:DNA helicase B-like [Amphiura filiformis]|uniref:DNA helicase B-like n=1 Tax=Amphiura filiformis TaxID=82378 RepID=UPI003B20F702
MAGIRKDVDSVGRKFRGYIFTDKYKNIESITGQDEKLNEQNDEEKRTAFDAEEMEAMLSSAVSIPAKKLKSQTVCIKSLENGEKRYVEGEFMYTQPWWEVTVETEPAYGRNKCIGKPVYRIRSDNKLDHSEDGSVMAIFLNECKIHKRKKRRDFLRYLREEAKRRDEIVNFTLLCDVIESCEEVEQKNKKSLCKYVKRKLLKSVHYRVMVNAMKCPTLMEKLPLLLPNKLPSLLERCSLSKLLKLDGILKSRPYLFGFQTALRRETGLLLSEVTYKTFEEAGLLQDMQKHIKDALFVYAALKEKSKKYGDTYRWQSRLKYFVEEKKEYYVADFKRVWNFLEKIVKVIFLDKPEIFPDNIWRSDNRLFLLKYYYAEKGIAENVMEIMNSEQNLKKCGHCEYCSVRASDMDTVDGSEQGQEEDVEMVECLDEETTRGCISNAEQPFAWSDDDDFEECPKRKPSGLKMTPKKKDKCEDRKRKLPVSKITAKKKDKCDNTKHKPSVLKMTPPKKNDKCDDTKHKPPMSKMTPLKKDKCDDGDIKCKPSTSKMAPKKNDKCEDIKCQPSTSKMTPKKNDKCDDTALPSKEGDMPENIEKELLERQAERDQLAFGNDKDQHAAAKSIRENPFTLIIGRGGCGKTHVVCHMMKEFCGASIVMAAPTGKAASNLRKAFEGEKQLNGRDIKAKTLHQVLYTRALARHTNTPWEFRNTEILVVDECSMVEVVLLSQVLQALMRSGKLKKLILMGDYRQLPAVDAGNLLEDLYGYFKQQADVCIELKTNHRAESQHINNCAIRISNQEMPDLKDKTFRLIKLSDKATHTKKNNFLKKLIQKEPDLQDDHKSQFVSFKKDDCKELNEWCCPIYAKHYHKMHDDDNKLNFQAGDKICPGRNANVTDIEKKQAYDDEKQAEKREKEKTKTCFQEKRKER